MAEMDYSQTLEPIYDRLRRMTPGTWQVATSDDGDPGWHILCDGRPLLPSPGDVAFLTHAADDIATLAAALEEANNEYDRHVASSEWLDRWRATTQMGIEDLCRKLGTNRDYADIKVLSEGVERLLAQARDQEAAIRTALLRPKSDEAVQALSQVLQRYK